MIIKTITISMLFGFQVATINLTQAQIIDLNLENVLVQFPNLSGTNCILQDRHGFMWFATRAGLKKFDGYHVIEYRHDPADPLSLSTNSITALIEGRDQSLWVGTINGLNKLNLATGKFTHYKFDPANPASLSHSYVTSLCLDQSSKLWIGTQEGGLNEMNILKREDHDRLYFHHYQHDPNDPSTLSDNFIRFILDDTLNDNQIMWIGTANGLNAFDKTTGKCTRFFHDPLTPNSLINNDLYSICQDKLGDLWIGSSEGWLSQLRIMKNVGIQFHHYKLGGNLKAYAISSDEFDHLWISTFQHGLFRFNKKNREVVHYDQDNLNLKGRFTPNTTFSDKSGILWIGTWPGLFKHDPNQQQFKFIAIDPPPEIWSMEISSLFEDNEEALWLGTCGRGVLKYDLSKGTVSDFAPNANHKRRLSSRFVQAILKDHSGIVWVATIHGLNRYNRQQDRFEPYYWDSDKPDNPKNLISNYIYCLHEDRQGNLWIGSARGLSRLDRSRSQFTHYLNRTDQVNMVGHYIGVIHQDRNDTFWLGGKGLFQFNPAKNELIPYRNSLRDSSSAIDAMVFDIFEDTSGNIWIATLNGLYRWSQNQPMTHFTEKDGLPNRFVSAIVEDDEGLLWISTFPGLTKYDPKSNNFRQCQMKAGFTKNEFIMGSCCKGKNGYLYFGQANGFQMFYPQEIRYNPHPPLVWISNFKVFDQPFSFDQPIPDVREIRLSYRQNFFTLDFVALNYTESQKNQYAYRLEGVDPDWVHCGTRRSASYTNIPPGKYVFKVKGSNNDGVWNEQCTSVRIIITPPWWRTGWASALYALILSAIVVGLWRFQIRSIKIRNELRMNRFEARKLQEIDTMKSRFFSNISHEFRTPLTLILGPLNQMLSQTKSTEKKQVLKLMQRNARRLQRLINQLLDLSKFEAGKMTLHTRPQNIVTLLNRIVQSFESQAKLKGIELKFNSEQDEIIAYIDQDKIENIFYNLLSNALKFTAAGGVVEVTVASPEQYLEASGGATPTRPHSPSSTHLFRVTVHDTGVGIPPDRLEKIFDRFYQVDDSYTREHEGSGIGLALTKELVELHHGNIEVQGELNRGTTFTVYLPLGKSHLKPEEIVAGMPAEEILTEIELSEGSEPADDSLPPSQHKALPLVLIVEDNRDMRSYLQDCLAGDYRIIEAADGEDGLHRAVDKIPDLIISDVMMPRMDGFEMCSRLKSDERTSHIPVILLTARASAESKIKGLELGADDYLIKPFDRTELLVRAKNLIEQRRKLREKFSRNIFLQPRDITISSYDQRFLQRAMNIVEQNIPDPDFHVDHFCKAVGMSRTQLHRKLRSLTNQSTTEFIRSLRLRRAAILLEKHYGNVTEIAYEVGFNKPSYFTECFRKQFGQLPSEYMKKA